MKTFLKTILCVCLVQFCIGQKSFNVVVETENNNHLITGIYNYVSIIAMQNKPVGKQQISAFLYPKNQTIDTKIPLELNFDEKNGLFMIHPKSQGWVEFQLTLNGKIEIQKLQVKPIPAVCRLSRYKANTEAKIKVEEFKAQIGLMAPIECCGFDANCKMIGFEIMRLGYNRILETSINKGGKFHEISKTIINKAKKGDIYIFKNIYYQCSSSERQRSEDFILEVI